MLDKFFKNVLGKQNILFITILLIVSIPSIFSLFHHGFFQSDDGEWMVIRFSAFHQAFRDGQIPVRFLGRLNYGYGYPVTNFLYPGFMYFAEPIHLLGFNFVDSIKIIFGISLLGSAIFTFLWLSKIFDKYSAFIGAIFYLYTPYHLFDLYKRGSIGEILALTLIPFILWVIEKKNIFFLSLGIFFLIISHNTLAFLFLPVLFLYAFLRKIMNIKDILMSFVFGTLLSSFFIIPAIFELQYVRFSNVQVSDVSKYFSSIDLIGISSFLILMLSLILFYKVYKVPPLSRWHLDNELFIFIISLGFLSIFLSSEFSFFLWRFLPSSFIQFPFRLLSYLLVVISFLAARIVFYLKDLRRYFVSLILVLVLGLSVFPFLKPDVFFDKTDGFYTTNEGTTTVQDEYLPQWVKNQSKEHFKEKIEIPNGKGELKNLIYNSRKINFDFNSLTDSKIRVNTIYYPGWKAFIDGKDSNIDYNNEKGVMDLSTRAGNHQVKLIFSETPLRLFADVMAIFSFVILILFSVKFQDVINRQTK